MGITYTYVPNSYPPNNLIRLSAQFYNLSNALVDPTTVILWVSGPDSTVSQYTATRDGVGLYHFDYLTATPGGPWYYRFQGLGVVKAQSPDTLFNVQISKF